MPIFTFMGSNILRRDDPYSLQVITETIDTVIPPLIKVRREGREGGRKRGWMKGVKGGSEGGEGREGGADGASEGKGWREGEKEDCDSIISPLQSCSVAPTKTKKKTTTKHTSKTAPTNAVAMVTEIIRTFVDAVPHIPGHRKHLLFSHLIRTMGAEDYLHVALGLLVEKQVVQSTAAGNREDRQVRTMGAEDYLHVALGLLAVRETSGAVNRALQATGR